MAKLKSFDQYISERDNTEDVNVTVETIEEANASGYIKAGKLGYNDQFIGRQSLSMTLSLDLGLNKKHQYGTGDWVGFDHVSMYGTGVEGTIIEDALTGKYTYEELKAAAAEWFGIKESEEVVEESESITESCENCGKEGCTCETEEVEEGKDEDVAEVIAEVKDQEAGIKAEDLEDETKEVDNDVEDVEDKSSELEAELEDTVDAAGNEEISESEEGEKSEEVEEEEEEARKVSDMLSEVYESCKHEAKVWADDAHDEHTVETYMKENAALVGALAAKSLKEMKEDYSVEAYEAACNEMIESYTKKVNEMKESEDAVGTEEAPVA